MSFPINKALSVNHKLNLVIMTKYIQLLTNYFEEERCFSLLQTWGGISFSTSFSISFSTTRRTN